LVPLGNPPVYALISTGWGQPICEQDHGSEQPTPVEDAEAGDEPEDPADNGEARLHHVSPLVGQLPLGEERAIVELKARGLLGDVDVDRASPE
jgi:hypothetical protein